MSEQKTNDEKPNDQETRAARLFGLSAGFWLWCLMLTAAGLRIIYLFQALPTPEVRTYEAYYSSDSAFFYNWAQIILSGDIWTDRVLHPYHNWAQPIAPEETWNRWLGGKQFHQEPLYPYFLALVLRLTGRPEGMFVLQALMGLLSLYLLFTLCRRMAGLSAAVPAAILYIGYGPFYLFETQLLRESMLTALGLLSVVLLDRARAEKSLVSSFVTGLVLGIFTIAKTSNVLFAAAAVFLAPGIGRDKKVRWLKGLAVAAGIMVCFIPPAIRNYKVGAPLLSLSSVAGQTFIAGNAPDVKGNEWGMTRYMEPVMRAAEGNFPVAAYLTLQAWSGRYGSYVLLLLKKIYAMLQAFESSDNLNYYQARRHVPLLRALAVNFTIISPLFIFGLYLGLKDMRRQAVPLIFLITGVAPLVIFYTCSRFRLPLAPLMCMYAGIGLQRIIGDAGRRNIKRAALESGLVIILALLLNPPSTSGRAVIRQGDYLFAAEQYLKKGEKDAALDEARKCAEQYPDFPRCYLKLADVYEELNERNRAEDSLKECIRKNPSAAYCHNRLGMIYLDRREYDSARESFIKAHEQNPGDRDMLYNLCLSYMLADEKPESGLCKGFKP